MSLCSSEEGTQDNAAHVPVNCPPFSEGDEFIEAFEPGRHSPYRIRKQLIRSANVDESDLRTCQPAPEGAEIYVHYECFDDDGILHDSSRQREFPYHFTLGESHAAPIWTSAVRSMAPGECAIFHCLVRHLYQPFKMPTTLEDVDSPLNVHVEYISWDDWSNVVYDGRIKKKKISKGSGEIATPNDGSTVTVSYSGSLSDGTIFEKVQDKTLVLCRDDIMEGLEMAIKSMCTGERSVFRIDPSYALGSIGDTNRNIPPDSIIEYDVELTSFSAGTLKWEMSAEEKSEFGLCCKDRGNLAFKSKHIDRAERLYNRALEFVEYEGETSIPELAKIVKIDAFNNLSIIKLNRKDFSEAIVLASKVLALDPSNIKALYRRAQAYIHTLHAELALVDIEKALVVDPDSTSLQAMCTQVKRVLVQSQRKQAQRFGGWCDRATVGVDLDKDLDKAAAEKGKPGTDTSNKADP